MKTIRLVVFKKCLTELCTLQLLLKRKSVLHRYKEKLDKGISNINSMQLFKQSDTCERW